MRAVDMFPDETLTIKPKDLLEHLATFRFLDPYRLAVYGRGSGGLAPVGPEFRLCGELASFLRCGEQCSGVFEKAVNYALGKNKPVVFRCRTGLLNFAVPFGLEGAVSYCLIGGALREHDVNLGRMESLAKIRGIEAFSLLETMDRMPAASLTQLKRTAAKVQGIIASFGNENLHSRILDKTSSRLNAVTAVSAQLDRIENVEEALLLLAEALGILFDLAKLAVLVRTDDHNGFAIRVNTGLPAGMSFSPPKTASELFPDSCGENTVVAGAELERLFPGSESYRALLLPVWRGEELPAIVALFDAELHERDIRLVELMTGRLSSLLIPAAKEGSLSRQSRPDDSNGICTMADPLTGLFNEGFALLRLGEELNRSGRTGESLAVLLVELANHGSGSEAGGKILKKTALLLKALLRQMDIVTRSQGEKFCIILPGASRNESLLIAERIRNKIAGDLYPAAGDSGGECPTISIGISHYPENGDDAVTLLQAAQTALQNAWTGGGNKIAHFIPDQKVGGKVISLHAVCRQNHA